jgi:group I intron endonuclease
MNYVIYLITNNINSKKYVGCTKFTAKLRFNQHIKCAMKGSRCLLHKDIRLYGSENFTYKTLLKNVSYKDHEYYERLWISKLHTYYLEGGYNQTIGGNGTAGYKFTEEAREKCKCAAYIGAQRFLSISPEKELERRNKIRLANTGRKFSYLHRKHISEYRKAHSSDISGPNNPFYGKHHTDISKEKISRSNSKQVMMYDKTTHKLLQTFKNGIEARNWLIQNGYCKSKDITSSISQSIKYPFKRTTCGFYWTH